jgi:KUP system potassium uptake protein
MQSNSHVHKISAAALLVTLGIIYGDIGTSPLYVMNAIVGKLPISEKTVLGGLSCIFWTLTLQTTVKYVWITLRADNKGEGGIFSLYTLVRRTKAKWLIIPAVIGGATLLADGIITPPISVASAIEGLKIMNNKIPTVPIVLAILTVLFTIQQFGTNLVGKFFGPIMLIWFSMLAILGIYQISSDISVFKAINPVYAYDMLTSSYQGFLLLGAVFLCTTGAEALYSDLGHCGRENIRITWIFVKTCLLLNYFGQGAWLLQHTDQVLGELSPFYAIMPTDFLPVGIIIATSAAIVASQALISGSFTLINEAIRLDFWPKLKVLYPSVMKGQLYIPAINWLMWLGCMAIVLHFRESAKMEAAYGLAIVLTMIMTTTLLTYYLVLYRFNKIFVFSLLLLYISIEGSFFIANLHKFHEGGWVTILISLGLISVMYIMIEAKKLKRQYEEMIRLKPYLKIIKDISSDDSIHIYSTHLVFLTGSPHRDEIEKKFIFSIIENQPKRAQFYWFVHVVVTDEPYGNAYHVMEYEEDKIIRVDFKIGFREAPKIQLYLKEVIEDMVEGGELAIEIPYNSLNTYHYQGDFRFIVLEKYLSNENELPAWQSLVLKAYFFLKGFSLSEEKAFGLEPSTTVIEKVPLIISPAKNPRLVRE